MDSDDVKKYKLFVKREDFELLINVFGVEKTFGMLADVSEIYEHNSYIGKYCFDAILNSARSIKNE